MINLSTYHDTSMSAQVEIVNLTTCYSVIDDRTSWNVHIFANAILCILTEKS